MEFLTALNSNLLNLSFTKNSIDLSKQKPFTVALMKKTVPSNAIAGTYFKKFSVFGGTVFTGARALCADGKVRSFKCAPYADTWFSVRASARIKGKYISGFVSCDSSEIYKGVTERGTICFHPHIDCKNYSEELSFKSKSV